MGVAADLDAQLRALAAAGGFRGAVRVECEGAVVVDAAYGRDRAGREFGSGAAFQIASVSKTFAAACALWLVGQGAISLDDPVAAGLGHCRRPGRA